MKKETAYLIDPTTQTITEVPMPVPFVSELAAIVGENPLPLDDKNGHVLWVSRDTLFSPHAKADMFTIGTNKYPIHGKALFMGVGEPTRTKEGTATSITQSFVSPVLSIKKLAEGIEFHKYQPPTSETTIDWEGNIIQRQREGKLFEQNNINSKGVEYYFDSAETSFYTIMDGTMYMLMIYTQHPRVTNFSVDNMTENRLRQLIDQVNAVGIRDSEDVDASCYLYNYDTNDCKYADINIDFPKYFKFRN